MKQYRYLAATELRMASDDTQAPKVTGYASVFNSPSEVLSDSKGNQFREVIRPGAFTNVLAANPDVRLLINHEGLPLARTTSGTLRLSQDERGLAFEADLDPTNPMVASLASAMRRGDLNQCSFAFNVGKGDAHYRSEAGMMMRDIHNVSELSDASLVTYPAYTQASASMRGGDVDDPELEAWLIEQKAQEVPAVRGTPTDVLKRRLNLLQL